VIKDNSECRCCELKNALENISKVTGDNQGISVNKKNIEKIQKWHENISLISNKIEEIEKNIIPLIESNLKYSFNNTDLLLTSFFGPSSKNVFKEIKEQPEIAAQIPSSKNNIDYLNYLIKLSEIAQTLAWIGDGAIKSALMSDIMSDIDVCGIEKINAKLLHSRRKKYEKNSNLAIFCDEWKLYENIIEIKKTTTKKLDPIKGTLFESVIGSLYIDIMQNQISKENYDINEQILTLLKENTLEVI